MLSLFCRFFNKPGIAGLLVLLPALLLSGPVGIALAQDRCEISPVAAFSRAMYASRYADAQATLPRLRRARRPELADFLQQVLNYMRAYEAGDSPQQDIALQRIDDLIDALSAKLQLEPSLQFKLTVGNIMINSARIQLLSARVLRSARLAKRGNQLLEEVLEADPQQSDALLGLGLYQYFAANENNAWGWIKGLLSLQGDKQRGRELIEQAAQQSVDYGFEAARTLMMDLNWDRPGICRYVALFDQRVQPDIQTIEHRQRSIAAALFCGRPAGALEQLQALDAGVASQQLNINASQRQWQFEARMQALAMQGDQTELRRQLVMQTDPQQRLLAVFALARAMDAAGQRERAVELYARVAAESDGPRYVRLAEIYAQQAYVPATRLVIGAGAEMRFACGAVP